MKISTTSRNKALVPRALAILFWLGVWQALSMAVGQEILLVSPVSAIRALLRMMATSDFYLSIMRSFGRILLGFALATALGALLAAPAYRYGWVRALLSPLMAVVKATPVASFVILALVWINSRNLSVFMSFLMVLPIIYTNLLSGLDTADRKLLEMARVFRVRKLRVARAIYLPSAFPYFLAGCRLSLGMCWKAGIAAEVIGQPAGSIGDKLYRAKIFLSTDDLFAWTLAIILLSVTLEKLVLVAVKRLQAAYGSGVGS